MSPYSQDVERQYLDRLQARIADFVHRYDANPSARHTTIFLFPGGLGSQLVRARQPADAGPPFAYEPLWLTCGFLIGGAKALTIEGGDDSGQRFILPDGYVDFVTLKPYGGFADWCASNWLDVFVVGWDWRRPGEATADFFLTKLLPAFEQGVAHCRPAPLDNAWIVGHSFGGIIAKHILNRADDPYVQRLKGAITVGTPFYGYGGQAHRFFVGDPDLNIVEGLDGAEIVTRIGSTLPASYELLFLDGPTYDANARTFAEDPQGYGLTAYPSMDAAIATERADPYKPSPGKPEGPLGHADYVRYPPRYGFDWDLLAAGHEAAKAVSTPLDPTVARKLWNIRGVQTESGDVKSDTVVSQTWARIPAEYVADPFRDPIVDAFGPGDGVIPAWSARLLGNPQVTTITGDDVDHMDLMNHGQVQQAIADIVAVSDAARNQMVATAKTVKIEAAARDGLESVTGRLRLLGSDLTSAARKLSVHEILKDFVQDDPLMLHKLHARAFMDALKSPSQKLKRGGG
jgi:pimeloyl-ACP methyl ester carboxylesterase